MTIKVEPCWGSSNFFRLSLPDGSRGRIEGDRWTRKTAKEALDLLEHVYHFPRKKIRFDVR